MDLKALAAREWTRDELVEFALFLAQAVNGGKQDEQMAVEKLAVATISKGKEPLLRAARRSLYEGRGNDPNPTGDHLLAADLCDQAIVIRRALKMQLRALQWVKQKDVLALDDEIVSEIVSLVLIAEARGENENFTSTLSPRQFAASVLQKVAKRSIGDDIDIHEVLRLAEEKAHAQEVRKLCARAHAYLIAHPDA